MAVALELKTPVSTYLQGRCMGMCPASEMTLRQREECVHPLEMMVNSSGHVTQHADPQKMVKRFSRSAAGYTITASEVRPYPVLVKTVKYMFSSVCERKDVPWTTVYEFVSDRLRAVRQDIVVQGLKPSSVLELLQAMTRFYLYAQYRLCECSIEEFDPYLNTRQLQETLVDVIATFHEADLLKSFEKKSEVEPLAMWQNKDAVSCSEHQTMRDDDSSENENDFSNGEDISAYVDFSDEFSKEDEHKECTITDINATAEFVGRLSLMQEMVSSLENRFSACDISEQYLGKTGGDERKGVDFMCPFGTVEKQNISINSNQSENCVSESCKESSCEVGRSENKNSQKKENFMRNFSCKLEMTKSQKDQSNQECKARSLRENSAVNVNKATNAHKENELGWQVSGCTIREEFECLYILTSLGNEEVLHRGLSLEKEMRSSPLLAAVLDAAVWWMLGNHKRLLQLMPRLPPLLSFALHGQLKYIQRRALGMMSVAYNSKIQKFSTNDLSKNLMFSSPAAAVDACRYYGLAVSEGHVVFNKSAFKWNIPLLQSRKCEWMDEKLQQISFVHDVLHKS